MKHKKELIKDIILLLYLFIFSLILFSLIWLNYKFGKVSLDQFLIHVEIILKSQLGDDLELSISGSSKYWLVYLPIITSFSVFIFIMAIKYYDRYKKNRLINDITLFVRKNYYKLIVSITIIFILLSIHLFTNFYQTSAVLFQSKVPYQKEKDYFLENFHTTKLRNKPNKNLIIIYLESFDKIFSNKEIFNEDLLSSLYKKTKELDGKVLFKINSTPGANWTQASLVASQCGIPLKPLGLNKQNLVTTSFLKNHQCISDYLKDDGNYHTEFITGTPLSFSNLDGFLKDHNFGNIYGKKRLIDLGYKENISGWSNSVSDQNTIDFLKKRIKYLDVNNKNYFINLLTVDTHLPGNYYDKNHCKNENLEKFSKNIFLNKLYFYKKFMNDFTLEETYELYQVYFNTANTNITELKIAVKCTSSLIENFIEFFKANKFENTNLFIVGDHEYFDFQNNYPKREIFNIYFGNQFNFDNVEILQYDLFPFFLKALGFNLLDNKSNFGIFPDKKTNILKRVNKINKSIYNDSEFYKNLW